MGEVSVLSKQRSRQIYSCMHIIVKQNIYMQESGLVRREGLVQRVEPNVCNWKASAHLCGKGLVLKTTLPQTPRSAGSLRHWIRPF